MEYDKEIQTARDAALRIINKHTVPIKKPTITELESILSQSDGPAITINPDGSIGIGEPDELIVARACLALIENDPSPV